VHASFEEEGKSQKRTIEQLRTSLDEKEAELTKQREIAQKKEAEATDATQKLER